MEHDFGLKNIVVQAVISPPHVPLPFACFKARKLFNFVLSAAVVGIVAENLNQFFEGMDQGGDFPGDRPELPLERGVVRTRNGPAINVLILSLLLLLALTARSFQFSEEFVRTACRSATILRRACLDLVLY
jgi:hypothetical protein